MEPPLKITTRNNQHDWFGMWATWKLKKTVCQYCPLSIAWKKEQIKYNAPDD